MKDFLDVVVSRKSVRSFLNDPVPREIIEKILKVAVAAPTNCNQQLWNFVVVDDPVVRERLVQEAAANTMFRRAPVVIAVTYDGWNRKEALQGASLAVGHLLLAATYYGLSGSAVNSYGADSKVKKVLEIPVHESICCFVTLGYPDEKAKKMAPVPRKELPDVLHWNIFTQKRRPAFVYDPNAWTLDQLRLHQRHYCRKTFLGKEMDLAGSAERLLVKKILTGKKGPFLDLMSYDGSYLRDFPEGEIDTLDLTPETAEYTRHAAHLSSRRIANAYVYDEALEKVPGNPATITLIYKAERLPETILSRLLMQAHNALPSKGELIIISRRRPSLFSLFYVLLPILFGPDVRRTGIYAFFGPYRPVRVNTLLSIARKAQFAEIEWNSFFLFPSFFEQAYQMVTQYIRSRGSSYLHRDRKVDIASKSIDALIRAGGYRTHGWFGSVAVIVCKK